MFTEYDWLFCGMGKLKGPSFHVWCAPGFTLNWFTSEQDLV